jgi:hypothetical protein
MLNGSLVLPTFSLFILFFFHFIFFLSLIILSLAGGDKADAVAAAGSTFLCA